MPSLFLFFFNLVVYKLCFGRYIQVFLFCFVFVFFLFFLISNLYCFILGDPVDNYFCRGTISVAEAYDRLLSAWYCTTQFLFVGFFFIMTALWQV